MTSLDHQGSVELVSWRCLPPNLQHISPWCPYLQVVDHWEVAPCNFSGLWPKGPKGQDPATRCSPATCLLRPGCRRLPWSTPSRQSSPVPWCPVHQSVLIHSLSDPSTETTCLEWPYGGLLPLTIQLPGSQGHINPSTTVRWWFTGVHVCCIYCLSNVSAALLFDLKYA